MSGLAKFFRRRCERAARDTRVRFQTGHRDILEIKADEDTDEMASSSETHGDDVPDAVPAEHDDLAPALPDIVTAVGVVRDGTAATSNHDTYDAVVAEGVPVVSELVAGQESMVKHRDHREVTLAEQAQPQSVSYEIFVSFCACVYHIHCKTEILAATSRAKLFWRLLFRKIQTAQFQHKSVLVLQ